MKKALIYLIAITFFACNEKENFVSDFEKDFGMYTVLINDIDFHSFYIEKQIDFELSNLDEPDIELKSLDSITKIYLSNLDAILYEFQSHLLLEESLISEDQKILMSTEIVNQYFFLNDSVSDQGKKFKEMTNQYRSELIRNFKDPIYQMRVQRGLRTDFIEDRNSKKNERLDYIFRDTPLIAAITYLKNLRKNALEYEFQVIAKKPVANTVY